MVSFLYSIAFQKFLHIKNSLQKLIVEIWILLNETINPCEVVGGLKKYDIKNYLGCMRPANIDDAVLDVEMKQIIVKLSYGWEIKSVQYNSA